MWRTHHNTAGCAADLTLIGFGPAGTWPTWWADFASRAPSGWDFVSIVLPGRAARIDEPPLTTVADQVHDVAPWVEEVISDDLPVHLVGVCSGALLAYEVAALLRGTGACVYVHLVNPPSPRGTPDISTLAGAEFEEAVVKAGMLPAELTVKRDVVELFIPALRGDITAAETCPGLAPWPVGSYVVFYRTHDALGATKAWRDDTAVDVERVVTLQASTRQLVDDPASVLMVPLSLEFDRLLHDTVVREGGL